MGRLKPIGSEKLKGDDKIKRIMEIARYGEVTKNDEYHVETNSFSKKAADGNTYAIIYEKDGYYLKCGITESELDYVSGFMNKKKDRFKSYSSALKRMNLIFKPLNEEYNEGMGDGMYDEEMDEQEKFVLNVPDEGGDEEIDMDMGDDMGDEEIDMDMEDDMGDEEIDVDVAVEDEMGGEEDMEGFMKSIQKLTGKLGQKLRDVEEEMGSADIKYVINSIISAVELENLDDEDREDILDRFEEDETSYGDEEGGDDIDMGDEELDIDLEGGDEDIEDVEGVEDVELEDEEVAMESLKNRVGNILESYIQKRETNTPQNYLKNRLNVVKDRKNLKVQYETVEQEMGTEKLLKENKEFKFAGKTKHNNIILKSATRKILVNQNGSVI